MSHNPPHSLLPSYIIIHRCTGPMLTLGFPLFRLLHAATAAFHEVRDHHRRRDSDREVYHDGPGSPVGREKKRRHDVPVEAGYN